jgi:hypothetical protein
MLVVRIEVLVWHPHDALSFTVQESVEDMQRQSTSSLTMSF